MKAILAKTAHRTQLNNIIFRILQDPVAQQMDPSTLFPTEHSTLSSTIFQREKQPLPNAEKLLLDVLLSTLYSISTFSDAESANLNALVKLLIRLYVLAKMKDWETLSNLITLNSTLPADVQKNDQYHNAVGMIKEFVGETEKIIECLPASLPNKEAYGRMLQDRKYDGEHYLDLHYKASDAMNAADWAT